ncbi:hypothetical protein [Francisella sp. SYW-9]|nr:hypothetical protein [Francisella sp. SYW-9]
MINKKSQGTTKSEIGQYNLIRDDTMKVSQSIDFIMIMIQLETA